MVLYVLPKVDSLCLYLFMIDPFVFLVANRLIWLNRIKPKYLGPYILLGFSVRAKAKSDQLPS